MDEIKQKVKYIIKSFSKRLLIILLPVILIIVLLASFIYYITLDDGTYKKDDKKSVSYVASTYTSNVSFTSDGLQPQTNAEDLWNQMKSDGAPVNNYLDSYDELEKMMNAEIETQYPKMGKGNIDGKIEFERTKSDGSKQKLSFIEKDKFEELKKNYESSGDTNVLNYFTLDDNSNVVVGVLSKTTEMIHTNDTDIDPFDYTSTGLDKIDNETYSKTIYNISTTKINYKSAVQKYTMPFQYLWSLLVITEDKDFVLDLVDLVDKSQFVIGIYDNVTTTTTNEEYTYDREKRTDTYVELDVKEDLGVTGYDTTRYWLSDESPNAAGNYDPRYEADYETTPYNVTYSKVKETSTISTNMDKLDTWIMKSESTNQYSQNNQVSQSSNTADLEDTEYEELSNSPENSENNSQLLNNEHALNFKKETNNYIINASSVSTTNELVTIKNVECSYFEKRTNRKMESTSNTTKTKNVQTVTSKEIKDDPNSKDSNFVTILNNNTKARMIVEQIPDWLFELIEINDSTADMEDLTRYLLYKATGNNYGVTTFDFSIYDVSKFNTNSSSTSGSSTNLLIEYIHSWEGCTSLSADGKKYIIEIDGGGNPTVGYGIDINAHRSEFEANGYSGNAGEEVDKDFVDSLEKQEITAAIENVKAETASLNLTGYQINALVSRYYNMGSSGWKAEREGKNFVQAYEAYWNKDTDDKFELKDENAVDFSHQLYTTYMKYVNSSNGTYLLGLERRRESEWKLFQTGYYDRIDKWHSNSGGNVLPAADEVHQDEIDWTYYTNGLYWNDIEMSINNPNKETCCATYVSCVLYKAGYFTEDEMNSFNYNECGSLHNFLTSAGWSEISSYDELEAGDIVFMNYNDGGKDYDHVQIYAGDDTWYNAGETSAIQRQSPYNQGDWARSNFFVAVRPTK